MMHWGRMVYFTVAGAQTTAGENRLPRPVTRMTFTVHAFRKATILSAAPIACSTSSPARQRLKWRSNLTPCQKSKNPKNVALRPIPQACSADTIGPSVLRSRLPSNAAKSLSRNVSGSGALVALMSWASRAVATHAQLDPSAHGPGASTMLTSFTAIPLLPKSPLPTC